MKKLLTLSVIGSSLLISSNPAKADWDSWGIKYETETINGVTDKFYNLYTINSYTGAETHRQRFCRNTTTCNADATLPYMYGAADILNNENHIDKDSFIIRERDRTDTSQIIYKKYTLSGDTISSQLVTDSQEKWFDDYTYITIRGNAQIDSDGNYYSDIGGQMWLKQTTDGTISFGKIGSSTATYSLSETGVSQNGTNLISRSSDGITSIGANSVKLQEISDIQRIWATNSSGTKIPINIYGSDLQINGVSVQGQIDTNKSNIKNLGSGIAGSTALTAALTALPQTSEESKHSCGIGSGAYSSRYAVGFGCASKVNERIDVNAGGSYVFGGAKSYGEGTLDNGVIKAGFVFKLGELNKPTQISMKETKDLKEEIADLKENNKNIIAQNNALLARLERLEKVALGDLKSKDLAIYQLK